MITFSRISNRGSRPVNEDSVGVGIYDKSSCFILCDGLGGHGLGDVASSIAVKSFGSYFASGKTEPLEFFPEAFLLAQKNIIDRQQKENADSKMKTTLVSVIIENGHYTYAHIGDSRLYCFKNGKIESRTLDHSVPQMLVRSGDISEEEIRFHPDRNKLLRALGEGDSALRYEIGEKCELEDNTAFLLCSDGFWEHITEDEMESALAASTDSGSWLDSMQDLVKAKGHGSNMDNFSAIAVVVAGKDNGVEEKPVFSELPSDSPIFYGEKEPAIPSFSGNGAFGYEGSDAHSSMIGELRSSRGSLAKLIIILALLALLAVISIVLMRSMLNEKKNNASSLTDPFISGSSESDTSDHSETESYYLPDYYYRDDRESSDYDYKNRHTDEYEYPYYHETTERNDRTTPKYKNGNGNYTNRYDEDMRPDDFRSTTAAAETTKRGDPGWKYGRDDQISIDPEEVQQEEVVSIADVPEENTKEESQTKKGGLNNLWPGRPF